MSNAHLAHRIYHKSQAALFYLARLLIQKPHFSRHQPCPGTGPSLFKTANAQGFAMSSMAPIHSIPTKFGEQPLDISPHGVANLSMSRTAFKFVAPKIPLRMLASSCGRAGVRTTIDLSKSEALHFAQCPD